MFRSGLTSDRWNQVEGIFHDALDRAAGARRAFLQDACGTDYDLLHEVERLLALHGPDDTFLRAPDEAIGKVVETRRQGPDLTGTRLGAFRIQEPIATGGMGSVWLGERADDHFQQRVAVKVMNWGFGTPDRRQRFARERQTLAQLEHPYITRLIDGGTTGEGLPYLVMEYVEGVRIDDYCDEHRLPVEARLRLFQKFCEAVHYAHQNLVVHRDLKPSNMLVAENGHPKLLDFGISKLLADAPSTGSGDATITFVRALTPRYASPEQIRGDVITTATDVYSLGVLLYELLTGHRPYRVDPSSSVGAHSVVCTHEPTTPSAVVASTEEMLSRSTTTDTITPEMIGELRGEPMRQLQRRLRGDLDNIVLMALQKEPRRRYASVQQFSEDIDRYLNKLPVVARKDSMQYRASKFVRRNKSLVFGLVAVIASLGAGVVGTTISLRQAQSERDIALKVSEVLQYVLATTEGLPGDSQMSLTEELELATARVDSDLGTTPAVEAAARYAIAKQYADLYRWTDAERNARVALTLNSVLYGVAHRTVGDCLTVLGRALAHLRDDKAFEVLDQAQAIRAGWGGAKSAGVAEVITYRAYASWAAKRPGDVKLATEQFERAIAMYRNLPPEEHRGLAVALHNYALMRGEFLPGVDEAIELFREAIDLYVDHFEREDRGLAESMRTLSDMYRQYGEYELEAEVLTRYLSLAPQRVTVDEIEQEAAWRLVLLRQDETDVAATVAGLRHAIARVCAWRCVACPSRASDWTPLFVRFSRPADLAQTVHDMQALIGTFPELVGVNIRRLSEHAVGLAEYAGKRGLHDPALDLMETCLEYQKRQYPNETWLHMSTTSAIGAELARSGQIDEGKRMLVRAYQSLKSPLTGLSKKNERRRQAARRLVEFYENIGRPNAANVYRSELPASEQLIDQQS